MAPMSSKAAAENLIRRATCISAAVLLFDGAAVDGISLGSGDVWKCHDQVPELSDQLHTKFIYVWDTEKSN
jgi:hypothetical protein